MSDEDLIETYKSDLQDYSLEQLRFKSAEEVWSLSQMYNHMILTALDYLDKVKICAMLNEEQLLGKTQSGELLFQRGAFPSVKIKLPDGPENNPSNSDTIEDLVRGLDQVKQQMREWESKLDTIHPNYKVKHDGFGWLNARDWFGLVDMHFRHHLRQKRELDQTLEL